MNQILSVEMQNNNSRGKKNFNIGEGKASTKSVIMFFCIILIVFGLTLSSLGVYSKINSGNENQPVIVDNPDIQETDKPKIEAIQNASEVEVEVSSKNVISKVEYRWNNEEAIQADVDGSNLISFDISDIPSGTNTLTIIATDDKGATETFTKEYVGEQEANAKLQFVEDTGKLILICQEEKVISTISYNYDDEEPKTQQVNNTQAELEIADIRQGEHVLTVTVTYQDGSSRKKVKRIYFPKVEKVKVPLDGNYAIVAASDVRKIKEVRINLNGVDLPTETVNKEQFEKTLTTENGIVQGENRLIVKVINTDGVSITKRTKWTKTN